MIRPIQTGRAACLIALSVAVAWSAPSSAREVSVASIAPGDLVEYESEAPEIQKLIEVVLDLTKKKLSYKFGSNSPEKRGMDCSGTVQYALKDCGLTELPRSSYDFYQWAKEAGTLKPTPDVFSVEDAVFDGLRPGDLLFWEGTYETGGRQPPISHVMIYLGTLKADGKGVVFGASDGRRYRGKRISGVSVFDWKVPKEGDSSKFVGYGPIPGFRVERKAEAGSATPKHLKSVLDNLFKKSEASSLQ